jgi:hypothetical protein
MIKAEELANISTYQTLSADKKIEKLLNNTKLVKKLGAYLHP